MSPLPVPGLLGRAGPRPCPITPQPGLSAPQPPAPPQGRQQCQAVPALLTAVPGFAGSAWSPRWVPTAPKRGCQSAVGCWGAWGEGDTSLLPAQPWGTVHMCVRTCAACMPVRTVSERDMHTCTCALSACVLCCEIPLPVQAACPHLPVRAQCLALSLAMATRGTLQALSHSKCLPGPRVPTVPTLDMTALCAYSLGRPQAAPASPSLGPTPHYPHG